jgi:hypothetical protein
MKGKTSEQLFVGRRALMKVGSPVRQWLYTLEDRPKAWLTPVQYTVVSEDAPQPSTGPQYVEVTIAKVMPPYAIVRHHDGRGSVLLWLDTREVHLFLTSE